MKTSKAQLRAIHNWRRRHKEQSRHDSYKSTARTFCRQASLNELHDLQKIINEREQYLKGEKND